MLSKEEIEKAKEYIVGLINLFYEFPNPQSVLLENNKVQYVETLLQYIAQLEQENNKQSKMIDEMAIMLERLKICYLKKEDGGELLGKYRCYNKDDWKQYFEKKVEVEK